MMCLLYPESRPWYKAIISLQFPGAATSGNIVYIKVNSLSAFNLVFCNIVYY